MKGWIRYAIGLSVALALSAAVVVASWPRWTVVRQGRNSVPMGELVSGREFGQTFRSPFSGLYRIDVLLATYARANHGPLRFRLYDGVGGACLVTLEVDAAQIADNAFHPFVFDPIADSAGREFFFAFEAPDATSGNAVTVWATEDDAYPDGQAYAGRRPLAGDMAFVAYHRPGLEALGSLLEQVRLFNPALWRARWFVAAAAMGWVIGVGLLLGRLIPPGE